MDNSPLESEKPKQPKMDLQTIGQIMLVGGIVVAVLGGALMLLSRLPFFSKLGSLPGDIRIEGQGFSCFIPIASMILVSLLLTIILNLIVRLINRQ
jgi:hypothetical protein